jgi:DNA-binding PadR family transcriptional regulator
MSDQSGFPLEQALLGFLMQEPVHGYALHQRAEQELGRIWYMGISNIYGTLKDLEEAGYVASSLDDQQYPPRKVYRVTPAGRETFLTWVREPVPAIRDMRVEFLAKLYFFHTLRLDGVRALITAQEMFCRERLEQLAQEAAQPEHDRFDTLVSEFRRRRIEATLDWLADCREDWVE